MDPLAFAVLCGISSGVAGFLFGGAIFNAIWKLLFRRRVQQMQEVNPYTCVSKVTTSLLYIHVYMYIHNDVYNVQ